MGQLSLENEGVIYNGIIIFKDQETDQIDDPWYTICRLPDSGFRVYYLEDLIKQLEKDEPGHLLTALFAPYMEKSDEEFAQNAKQYYHQIKDCDFEDAIKERLEQIFLDWLSIRLKKATAEEVKDMLALDTPFEETQVYKDLVQIGLKKGELIGIRKGEQRGEQKGKLEGKREGEIKGVREQIILMKRLKEVGPIQGFPVDEQLAELEQRLEDMLETSDNLMNNTPS